MLRREVEDPQDLGLDLLGRAEDVGVVLGEAAHAEQAVQGAAALVAVDGAELGPAQGQVAVGAHPGLVDLDVEGAVHRLDVVVLPVDVHRRVHAVLVEAEVARGLPEDLAADVRGVEDVVAAGPVALAPVLLDDGPDAGALGVPEDQAAAELLGGAEEVELGAEPAVVALLGLFEQGAGGRRAPCWSGRRCRRCAGAGRRARRPSSRRPRPRGSLKCLSRPVEATWGPRQKSTKPPWP